MTGATAVCGVTGFALSTLITPFKLLGGVGGRKEGQLVLSFVKSQDEVAGCPVDG